MPAKIQLTKEQIKEMYRLFSKKKYNSPNC